MLYKVCSSCGFFTIKVEIFLNVNIVKVDQKNLAFILYFTQIDFVFSKVAASYKQTFYSQSYFTQFISDVYKVWLIKDNI